MQIQQEFHFLLQVQIKWEPVKIQLVLIGFLSWKFSVQLVMSDHVNSTGIPVKTQLFCDSENSNWSPVKSQLPPVEINWNLLQSTGSR